VNVNWAPCPCLFVRWDFGAVKRSAVFALDAFGPSQLPVRRNSQWNSLPIDLLDHVYTTATSWTSPGDILFSEYSDNDTLNKLMFFLLISCLHQEQFTYGINHHWDWLLHFLYRNYDRGLSHWHPVQVLFSALTDAPIINCTESRRKRATPGQTATFSCSIRANPNCDDVTWTYADGNDMERDLHTDPNIRISYKVYNNKLQALPLAFCSTINHIMWYNMVFYFHFPHFPVMHSL